MGYSAKTVVFDFADSWGSGSFGLRSIDFYSSGTKLSLSASDFVSYATSRSSAFYDSSFAFDTSLSKTYSAADTSWHSSDTSLQRLIIVFNTIQDFDSIVINNYHSSGGATNEGVKSTVITITLESYTTTTYGVPVTSGNEIWSGTINEHIASNIEDEYVIDLSNTIEFSIPVISKNSLAWLGDSILWTNEFYPWPMLESNISATTHPLGINFEFPIIEPEILATFAPRVADVDFDLPIFVFSGNATANKLLMDVTFPEITATIHSGGNLEFNIPELLFSFLGASSAVSNALIELPALFMEATTGAKAAFSFPAPLAALAGRVGLNGDIDQILPALSMSGESSFTFDVVGSIDSIFPAITMRGVSPGIIDSSGDMDCSLPTVFMVGTSGQGTNLDGNVSFEMPAFEASFTALQGIVGLMSFDFPFFKSSITSIAEISANLSVNFPEITSQINTDSEIIGDINIELSSLLVAMSSFRDIPIVLDDDVLRHVRNKVR